jgi:hypothetical protein
MKKERTVKCMATGVLGTPSTFYQASNKRYFQSEAVYQAWLQGKRSEKAKRNNKPKRYSKPGRTVDTYKRLCGTIAGLLGYDGEQPMPTIVFRKLKELDFYSDEIIQETLEESRNAIEWAFNNKEFRDDSAKACYMMAVVRNKIAEIYQRSKDKFKIKTKNETPMNLDTILDSNGKYESKPKVQKDISNLIGDDDLWM